MLGADRSTPFLSGLVVAAVLAGGLVWALPERAPDVAPVVIEPASAVEQGPVEAMVAEEPAPVEPEAGSAAQPIGPVPAVAAGHEPSKSRAEQVDEPEEKTVEEQPKEQPKLEAAKVEEAPKAATEPKADGEAKKDAGAKKDGAKKDGDKKGGDKKQGGEDHDGKQHDPDGKRNAWWPQVHSQVTGCSGEGDAAKVDWDVKLWGGDGWKLVAAGGADTHSLGDGNLRLSYTGSSGEYWPDHDKIRVSTTIVIVKDGTEKNLHAEAWAYLDGC